jgi:hypothetical protein
MLALLEECVTELGGTYAMEDTDSMAIVATKRGSLISCPGGPLRLQNGDPAIKALSWAQVDEIVKRFHALNPYDREAVPGSILQIEKCNFDPSTRKQRQIWCYAVSAKRYALFTKNKSGMPTLLPKGTNGKDKHCSEHGLGHLLNPIDPKSEDRNWIAQIWEMIISKSLGIAVPEIHFTNVPAMSRLTITSAVILKALEELNRDRKYSDQIKPFNFLLSCHIVPFGNPPGTDPAKFHLIAPFELDSNKWRKMDWIDQYSSHKYKINSNYSSTATARVKTIGDVIADYEHHPEAKCADEHGRICEKQTVGLLYRRHIQIGEILGIGKESNHFEEVDAGLVHTEEDAYTIYRDPKRDKWEREIRPKLQKIPLSLLYETGLSRRALIKARRGHVRPHARSQALLVEFLNKLRPAKKRRE